MTLEPKPAACVALPPLADLGPELARVSHRRRLVGLALPFLWCGAYFAFAALGWWAPAVTALMALSFVTYGSVSHDLVHRNLGLSRRAGDVLLCLVELLGLRSGHAYRAAHLHHHARYPGLDDIESAASRKSLLGALVEGVAFQPRIWLWAVRRGRRGRGWMVAEGIACVLLAGLAAALAPWTPIPLVYVVLMVMGGWIIPLVTAYLPHDPEGEGELGRTRAFRGVVVSVLAVEHLYHLEHHLYPSVPHHNWPELARRLDPHLEKAGVKPIKLWF